MIYIITGAGVSAESGIRTFRDTKDGLWNEHSIEEVCSINTFLKNYDKVHEFYNGRRVELGTVKPNKAHHIITKIQKEFGAKVITTNVDDLHERAGTTDVLHLHGELTKIVDFDSNDEAFDVGYTNFDTKNDLGIRYKPAVTFFGEMAPKYRDLFAATCQMTSSDTVIFVGMSFKVIPYQMCLPAHLRDWPLVININPCQDDFISYNPYRPAGVNNILKPATDGMEYVYDSIASNKCTTQA